MLAVELAPNLPWVIRNGVERAAQIAEHPDRFPEITGRIFAPGTRLRRRHRARLEAIALVVAALIRRCDLRTYRVGDQRDDGLCNGVPLAKLQEHTGLSRWRLSRAIGDLVAAGYLTSVQPVEAYFDAEGATKYRGFPSVRTLSPLLFDRLQLSTKKLSAARTRAAERWKARHAAPASARALLASRKAVRQAKSLQRSQSNTVAYNARLLALREEHPEWPAERIRAEAARLLH